MNPTAGTLFNISWAPKFSAPWVFCGCAISAKITFDWCMIELTTRNEVSKSSLHGDLEVQKEFLLKQAFLKISVKKE